MIPYIKPDRCFCTDFIFGGYNTDAAESTEAFLHTDDPVRFVRNGDAQLLRDALECKGRVL